MNTIVKSLLEQTIAEPNVSGPFKNELRRILNAGDVLADAGSRVVPCWFVTKREGEEIDRWKVEPITIRQHNRLTTVYSKLAREFEYDEETGEIVSAIIINELAPIER